MGHGGGAQSQHTYCTAIPWDKAQPGDLVFYPDNSHVGIVGGRNATGILLIVHCTPSGGVVITGRGALQPLVSHDTTENKINLTVRRQSCRI